MVSKEINLVERLQIFRKYDHVKYLSIKTKINAKTKTTCFD